jgi:hypothetical protein
MPVEAASPLGCVEQWQWCNSAYPGESGCGPLASLYDSVYGAAPFFNVTSEELDPARPFSSTKNGTRLIWPVLIQSSSPSIISEVLSKLGDKSLSSQFLLNNGVQGPLPLNQWQLDVNGWYNTVLASIQAMFVQTALGDAGTQQAEHLPLSSIERNACNSQVCAPERGLHTIVWPPRTFLPMDPDTESRR